MVRKGVLTAAAAAVLVYANALDNPFVYDDHDTILRNPSLADLGNLRFVLGYSLFRPIVNLSYALDHAVWGLRPFGFHATNVLLHGLNVVLFWRVAADAIEDRGRLTASRRLPSWCPLLAAVLWAVHPLMSEAVGYVSGRSEVLCATWFLAALIAFRRALVGPRLARGDPEPGRTVGGMRTWLAAGWLAFLLALGSKETAVMLPFVLIAWDALLVGGGRAERVRRALRIHLPLVIAVVAAGGVRLATLLQAEAPVLRSPMENALTQTIVILRYVRLIVWPVGQSLAHEVRQVSSVADPAALAAVATIAAALAAGWRWRRREPLALFGAVWFLLLLAPSSSLVALREGMAEHRVYLASTGLFLTIAAVAAPMLPARRERLTAGGWAATAVVVVLLSALTLTRNRIWADPVRLWGEAAERAPSVWHPHYALGDALRERGQCAEAIGPYETAVRLAPTYRDAFNNLGICLAEVGRPAEARAAFRRALEIDPRFARAHTNLGNVAILSRDTEEARRQFLLALDRDPGNIAARRQLAALYEQTFGDPVRALEQCRAIARIAPSTPGVDDCIRRNEARLR
jgi:tetratricopeptide (TPR) repeat protein